MMQYPKTLVLTESPFSSTNGFGVTLATLMADWPNDRFMVLYRSRRFWDETCSQLQEARDRMVHMPLPGRPLLNPVHVRELKGVLIPYLLGRTCSWFGRYSRSWIDRTLSGWKPEVIYCWYYSPVVAHYGAWLSEQLGVPQVVHIGDEVDDGKTPPEIVRVLRNAAARIAISGEMKAVFEERFGVPFEVVHNGAAPEIFRPPAARRSAENEELVLRYIGSLLRAHQWGAIEEVAEAVARYNASGGKSRFEIYCPDWTADLARELAERPGVVYAGFAEKPRNYELLKTADLLVLPISFEEENFRWLRLSMPTKLPEYLGSGTPTLIYGPRGCAPVEFCVDNRVGIVQSQPSVAELVRLLERLGEAGGELRRKAANDRRIAEAMVSARAMREKLRNILLSTVRSLGGSTTELSAYGDREETDAERVGT